MSAELPAWAAEMRDLFRSGSAAAVHPARQRLRRRAVDGQLLSLPAFLDEVMFANYDVVLHYDRSRGVRATRGVGGLGRLARAGARPARRRR